MPNNILITPGSASIQFSGSAANTIRLQVEQSGSIAFYGNSGSLFGITDQLSGSLMSVNDISGLPILEVFSDDRVVMGTFGKNTLVVSGSVVTVSGSLLLSGSTNISTDGGGSGAGFPFSGSAVITGSLLVSGSPGTELTVIGDTSLTGSLLADTDTLTVSGSLLTTADTLIFTGSFASTGSFSMLSDADTLTISGSLLSTADTIIFSGSSYFSGSTFIYGESYIDGGIY